MVEQFELDNPFLEGANSVYVLQDGGATALVDTGVSTEASRAALERKLGTLDIAFEDIDQIFLTHWHTDHAGLAGDIQARSDAAVHVHDADAGLAGQDEMAWREMLYEYGTAFERWGMSANERTTSLDWVDTRAGYWGRPADVRPFESGATFTVGSEQLRAIRLPGHTLGSVGYVIQGETGPELFSGDTWLPGYTPNIGGGEYREVETQLEQFLESLQRIANSRFVRAFPGHRAAIQDTAARARSIVQHHWDRLANLVEIVRAKDPATVRETARHLFGTLEDLHIFIGCAETAMHLEYLKANGMVRETEAGYTTRADVTDRLEATFEELLG
jgi:glyoxylase-like metal-dependent hydrolase (beta-lactamase superfamily II)